MAGKKVIQIVKPIETTEEYEQKIEMIASQRID